MSDRNDEPFTNEELGLHDSLRGPQPTTDKVRWKELRGATKWSPQVGDELIGKYVRRLSKQGAFGPYVVHHVRAENGSTYQLTGVSIDNVLELCPTGSLVKILCADEEVFSTNDGCRVKYTYRAWVAE